MSIDAEDSNNVPRFLLVDSSGRLILGPSAQLIGEVKPTDDSGNHMNAGDVVGRAVFVKITDGTETASINTNNYLEAANEHALKGKTMLYDSGSATNEATTIRTVTTGKTYYLTAAGLKIHATADEKWAAIYLGTSATIILYLESATTATYNTAMVWHETMVFPHPLPIAAGTAIKVESSDAAMKAFAWLIGWEE